MARDLKKWKLLALALKRLKRDLKKHPKLYSQVHDQLDKRKGIRLLSKLLTEAALDKKTPPIMN